MPSVEVLRASQLETPGVYLNRHLPPALLLSEAGWHGTEAFPTFQLEFLISGPWDIHHLAQHPPEGQVMQTRAGKQGLKVEVDLNTAKVYGLCGKGLCCTVAVLLWNSCFEAGLAWQVCLAWASANKEIKGTKGIPNFACLSSKTESYLESCWPYLRSCRLSAVQASLAGWRAPF